MTKMLNVTIDTDGTDQEKGKTWAEELANIYADMEISDVKVSGDSISFKAGLSGMEDTEADDIQMKVEEYASMNEAFKVKSLKVS